MKTRSLFCCGLMLFANLFAATFAQGSTTLDFDDPLLSDRDTIGLFYSDDGVFFDLQEVILLEYGVSGPPFGPGIGVNKAGALIDMFLTFTPHIVFAEALGTIQFDYLPTVGIENIDLVFYNDSLVQTESFDLEDFQFSTDANGWINTGSINLTSVDSTILSFEIDNSEVPNLFVGNVLLDNLEYAPVPEPATVGLLTFVGLFGWYGMRSYLKKYFSKA